MPKKTKDKKQRKSPTCHHTKKVPKTEDKTCRRKSHKREKGVKNRKTRAKDWRRSVKDDSHSSHRVKKPIYRLSKTQEETKKKSKDKQHADARSVSVHLHGERSCSKVKQHIPIGAKNVTRSKTTARKRSKPSDNSNEDSAHHTPKIPKRTEEIISPDNSSKLKKPNFSPSLSLTVKEDLKKSVEWAEEPSRTQYENTTCKLESKDSPQQNSRKEIKNSCISHCAEELPAKKRLCTDPKEVSASVPSAQDSTSGSLSKLWKKVQSECKSDTSDKIQQLYQKFVPFKFRIPKKVSAKTPSTSGKSSVFTQKKDESKCEIHPPDLGVLKKKPELKTVQACTGLGDSSSSTFKDQDKRLSSSVLLPPPGDTSKKQPIDQGRVVGDIYRARSEKRLEVDVLQSCGELTCMDIDSPEEGPSDTQYKKPHQQDLILVLDTNILLSHLDYVKKIMSCGLGALGFPVVLIPWVVLQELDSLKQGRGQLDSVAHLANPAISYIYTALKTRDPRLWGQSVQQAASVRNVLDSENNDDRVLQCCLQYQNMYPECAVILCTNDKNLCNKAFLSGVNAFCKTDLEAEVRKSPHCSSILQSVQPPVLHQINPEVSSPTLGTSCTSVQPCGQDKAGLYADTLDKDNKDLTKKNNKQTDGELSQCLSELEECLQLVLSDVLELEMKAVYEDIWLEIVHIKPPWTLQCVLKCFKKHWIAVFGHVVPRRMQQTVINLINFFSSGKTVNCYTTSAILQEAKELVKAFWKRSKCVPQAITKLEYIFNKLQPQNNVSVKEEFSACDVNMKDDDEDKAPTPARVSHQDVWAMFENIWSCLFQKSLEVFKVLGFDPHTMQTTTPMGGPGPPLQDTLACLHNLSSMVSQLLQAFSSFLSSTPGSEELQTLLNIVSSTKIVHEDPRLTTRDLLDCFSQPEYREKLQVGGNQLQELKNALDCCVQARGQHITFTT